MSSGTEKYLRVRLDRRNELAKGGNEYKLHMLCENTWKYMIKPITYEENGFIIMHYSTSSNYILNNMLSSVKPDGSILKIICSQLHKTIKCIREYLLDVNDLVIDGEYMLYNQNRKELKLIYIPGYGKSLKHQIRKFIENMMKIFDYRDKEGIVLLYQMYDRLTDETESIDDILMDAAGGYQGEAYADIGKPYTISCETKPIEDYEIEAERVTSARPWRYAAAVGICDGLLFLKYLSDKSESIILVASILLFAVLGGLVAYILLFYPVQKEEKCTKMADCIKMTDGIKSLCPITNGAIEDITIDGTKTKIFIGRDKRDVDYQLETTQISRIHACVEKQGENTYIMDMNSTNGTFINDMRIVPMQMCLIKRGDIIKIADEEFYCR